MDPCPKFEYHWTKWWFAFESCPKLKKKHSKNVYFLLQGKLVKESPQQSSIKFTKHTYSMSLARYQCKARDGMLCNNNKKNEGLRKTKRPFVQVEMLAPLHQSWQCLVGCYATSALLAWWSTKEQSPWRSPLPQRGSSQEICWGFPDSYSTQAGSHLNMAWKIAWTVWSKGEEMLPPPFWKIAFGCTGSPGNAVWAAPFIQVIYFQRISLQASTRVGGR